MAAPLSNNVPSAAAAAAAATPTAQQPTVKHMGGTMFLIGGQKREVTHLDGKALPKTGPLTENQFKSIMLALTQTFDNNKEALAAIKDTKGGFTIKPNIKEGTTSIIDHQTNKVIAQTKIRNIGSQFTNQVGLDTKHTKASSVNPHSAELKLAANVKENNIQSLVPKSGVHTKQSLEKLSGRLAEIPKQMERLTSGEITGHTLLGAQKLLKELDDGIALLERQDTVPLPKGIKQKREAEYYDLNYKAANFSSPKVGLIFTTTVKDALKMENQEIFLSDNKNAIIGMLSEALSAEIAKAHVLTGPAQEEAISKAKQLMGKLESLQADNNEAVKSGGENHPKLQEAQRRINEFRPQLNTSLKPADENRKIDELLKKEPVGASLLEAYQRNKKQKAELSKDSPYLARNEALAKEIQAKATAKVSFSTVEKALNTSTEDINKGKIGKKETVIAKLSGALSVLMVRAHVLTGTEQEEAIRTAKQIMKKLENLGEAVGYNALRFKEELDTTLRVPNQNSIIKGQNNQIKELLKEPYDGADLFRAQQINENQRKLLSTPAQRAENEALKNQIIAKAKALELKSDSYFSKEKDIMKAFEKGGPEFEKYIVTNFKTPAKKEEAYKFIASELTNLVTKANITGSEADLDRANKAMDNLLKLPNEIINQVVQEKNMMNILTAYGDQKRLTEINSKMSELVKEKAYQHDLLEVLAHEDISLQALTTIGISEDGPRDLARGLSRLMNEATPESQKWAGEIIKGLWKSNINAPAKSGLIEAMNLVDPNLKEKVKAYL